VGLSLRRIFGDDGAMSIEAGPSGREIFSLTYRGTFSDSEYEAALASMTRELERARAQRRKIALVSVGTPDSSMTSKQRRRSSDWLKEQTELLRSACVGQAVVVPGTVQRGVLTAILWMGDHPVPMRACSTEDEANQWARSLLDRAGAEARV